MWCVASWYSTIMIHDDHGSMLLSTAALNLLFSAGHFLEDAWTRVLLSISVVADGCCNLASRLPPVWPWARYALSPPPTITASIGLLCKSAPALRMSNASS